MLGIIFGVASVIAMLSIGEGAKKEAIAKYKELGVNNIIVRDKKFSNKELEEIRAKFSQGLSMNDANSIKDIVPMVEDVAPQSELSVEFKLADKSCKGTLIGVTPVYSKLLNVRTEKGTFITNDQYKRHLKVCVLGAQVVKELFPFENPIGKSIKVDDQWLEVVGVMNSKSLFSETVGELASRDLNTDVYIPLTTMNKRFSKKNPLDSEINQIKLYQNR